MHTLLTGSDPLARDILLTLWRDVFDRARKAGELRPDSTDAELIEWLSGVQMMLSLREDLAHDRERQLLEKFFLPAFLTPVPQASGSDTTPPAATRTTRGRGTRPTAGLR